MRVAPRAAARACARSDGDAFAGSAVDRGKPRGAHVASAIRILKQLPAQARNIVGTQDPPQAQNRAHPACLETGGGKRMIVGERQIQCRNAQRPQLIGRDPEGDDGQIGAGKFRAQIVRALHDFEGWAHRFDLARKRRARCESPAR